MGRVGSSTLGLLAEAASLWTFGNARLSAAARGTAGRGNADASP